MRQVSAQSQNRTLFFELWWKNTAEEVARRLLAAAGDYRYWLESLRRQKPHTLNETEEQIINLKNVNGRAAFEQLYMSITNGYSLKLSVKGEVKTLTLGELFSYFGSPDANLRTAAYQELYRVYQKDALILGQIFQTMVHDWYSENLHLRHFSAPIAVRNLKNDIPNEVVNTLLEVIQANAPLFQRYFRLKAKWLGGKVLPRYDIYAPIGETTFTYPFNEAVDLVLSSFQTFEPQMAELAQRVFSDNHIDSEVRPGKDSGAFSTSIAPDLTPWVLQSYHGKPRDVTTLAHELGHAIHAMLAADHTALTYLSSLPLAETASTFSEMLLVDFLLAHNPDEAIRRALLFNQMDEAYATIMRQGYFALFEQGAYKATQSGASVTDLCALYLENLAEQFGDAVAVTEEFRFEWLVISHFYSVPFYVYAYAFGELLVLSLYEQYQQEGKTFIPRYLDILAAGGAASPGAILTKAGIKMADAAFWQSGFNVLARRLNQLETMSN
jgi:oligoendopeptidase F